MNKYKSLALAKRRLEFWNFVSDLSLVDSRSFDRNFDLLQLQYLRAHLF